MKAVITRDGSIRLPAAVRARLDLEPGTPVRLDLQHDFLVVRRATRRAAAPAHEPPVHPDPSVALRRDAAGEAYVALSYERRVHE